jgi:hypothetical protein
MKFAAVVAVVVAVLARLDPDKLQEPHAWKR